MGMKVIATLYTQGPYDLITISEVSDEKMANAFALATVAQGNVRSTTMRAFDPDEFEAIVKMTAVVAARASIDPSNRVAVPDNPRSRRRPAR